jgi:hypothetical protein
LEFQIGNVEAIKGIKRQGWNPDVHPSEVKRYLKGVKKVLNLQSCEDYEVSLIKVALYIQLLTAKIFDFLCRHIIPTESQETEEEFFGGCIEFFNAPDDMISQIYHPATVPPLYKLN